MVIHFQPRAWALWNWHLKEKHLPTPPCSFSVFKKYKRDRPSQSVRQEREFVSWECLWTLALIGRVVGGVAGKANGITCPSFNSAHQIGKARARQTSWSTP